MTTRPMLTQRDAATACGVSRSTIRRRREDGAFPNAVQDPARGWLIPVDDLLAAGFRLHAPAPPDEPGQPPATAPAALTAEGGHGQDAATLRAELERVRQEHALELAQAQYGKQLAQAEAEHLRQQLAAKGEHIADLQKALQALMPAPERAALPQSATPAVPAQAHHGPAQEQRPLRPRMGSAGGGGATDDQCRTSARRTRGCQRSSSGRCSSLPCTTISIAKEELLSAAAGPFNAVPVRC
ncbi:hypothetical protein QWM81_25040 [Streptomyces ficellus]|uniref:Helix-turn-helix domain-containing protein n=1 Tax=Streptomyces ficellus TaxID=1977088 RepID=A0ABT7ZCS2_9ACTN|nr:hypothetical protein [Streptomyces ficellus]